MQFRVTGPEIDIVRGLAAQVAAIMRRDRDTTNVQFDWDEPAERSVHFEVDQTKARQLNVSSQDIQNFLDMSLSGYTITRFRERDKLIGVDLRAPPRRTRGSLADRASGDPHCLRRGPATGSARSIHVRTRVRRHLGTRSTAYRDRRVRCPARRPGDRRDGPGRPGTGGAAPAVAGELSHRHRRLRRRERQGQCLDRRAAAGDGDRGYWYS